MDVNKPDAPAQKAPVEIEILPPGTSAPKLLEANPDDSTDRFLKEATFQYSEGHLDQPLWDRALAQAKGDKEAAVDTYLHARAIALRLLDRERRTQMRTNVVASARKELADEAEEMETFDVDQALRLGNRSTFARYGTVMIAVAIVVALAVGGWLTFRSPNNKPVDGIRSAPVSESAKTVVPSVATTAKPAGAVPLTKPTGASPELLRKIQELRDAGNANVLVLYLVEWTRKEPANSTAWDQLRAGYAALKQYDDALAAAKKAQELSPEDARLWHKLGVAHADAGDPVGALRAFDQAVARDDQDADAFRQIGILNAQLSQIQEAGRAFDKALALHPGDHVVLCMRTAVAALSSAPKDTYATAKQVRAIDAKCRGS
jgi:tetratricopeptide (TPR) repeat protein